MLGGLDLKDTMNASKQAEICGVAPEVLDYSEQACSILFKHAGPDWRPALANDLDDVDIRANAIAAKRLWHTKGEISNRVTLLDVISKFQKRMQEDRIDGSPIKKPNGYRTMADWIERICKTLAATGIPDLPLHSENTVTNVLIGPDKAIKLVDFDRVCRGDGMYDLGAFCLEFCQFDHQLAEAVEMYNGHFDEKL